MKTKEERNKEYLEMIDESIEQIKNGKYVIKTMEELEEMAKDNEDELHGNN